MRGLFGTLAGKTTERRNEVAFDGLWQKFFGGMRQTDSGQAVNWLKALEVPTALRCALSISDGVSTVPCKIMLKDPKTGRRSEAVDHPLYPILSIEANEWMDPLEYLETMTLHTVFMGNSYSFINRIGNKIVELIPLDPGAVRPRRKTDYSIVYDVVALDGSFQEFPAQAIWHMRGPSWNSWMGLDAVYLAREAIGLSIAARSAHAKRFGNGVQTTGVYSFEGDLTDTQYTRMRAWIEANHVGMQNSGKPFILDKSAKWLPTSMSGVDAQHIELRKMQIEEICSAFGVNPIMVGYSDKTATYASAEQMFLAHTTYTIRPWHRRFERSMKRNLLTRKEIAAGYYIKFIDTELLRGDATSRSEYMWKMFQMGVYSPNGILEHEDEDGFEGGDKHYVPVNMVDVNAPPAPVPSAVNPAMPAAPANDSRRNKGRVLSGANEKLIRDATGLIGQADTGLNAVLDKLAVEPEVPDESGQ